MKKTLCFTLAVLAIGLAAFINTGCITSQVTTGTGTNAVTTTLVNTNNLNLYATALRAAVGASVSILAQNDATTIGPIKTAQTALDGVLNGANQMTTQEALTLMKVNSTNVTLTNEATYLINLASTLEQQMISRYSSFASVQIAYALAQAANQGISDGLSGLNTTTPPPPAK